MSDWYANTTADWELMGNKIRLSRQGIEVVKSSSVQVEANATWRFLPAIPVSGSALVLGVSQEHLGNVVYDPLVCMPAFPTDRYAYSLNEFDFVAFPTRPPQLTDLPTLRSWVRASGVIYLGLSGKKRDNRNLSVQNWVHYLRRAGFPKVSVFGALSDRKSPTYFFPLTTEAMTFALRRYLHRKHKAERLVDLASPRLLAWFRWRLPAYGLVAGRHI